jgi:hemoglobin/transferrin/lactoferrin receptor protein
MRKIILWSCMVLFYHVSSAQVLTLVDAQNNEPLEAAAIISETPSEFTTTNVKGQAEIGAFKGSNEIQIRMIGYEIIVKSYNELKELSFIVPLKVSAMNLDQVVISASRSKQVTAAVPEKISVISSKEVSLQNPQTAADLLNVSGEVYIQKSQQGGGSPMIRGFSTNRLLYTVDGVRMNNAIFRSGNLQNVISLDPFAIEKTEILFGPGSNIYGSDAIGGVMSFQTLTPQLSLDEEPLVSGVAAGRYSIANQENTGHFNVNVGWKKWSILSSISANKYGDLKMGSNGPDDYLRPYYVERLYGVDVIKVNEDPKVQNPSGYSQINMMQKIRFKPNEKWDFQYGFHYSETSDYSRYDRHQRLKNGLPRYGEWAYGPQKWMMNNLNITHQNKTAVYDEFTIRLAQQSFEESRISRDFGQSIRETRLEGVEAYSFNMDFNKKLGSRNDFFYGIEGVYNDVTSTGFDENILTGASIEGAPRYPKSTWGSYAAYVNDQFQLTEKVMLQAGLRYSNYQIQADFDTSLFQYPFTSTSLNNDAVTGSFGVVVRPTDHLVLTANAATGFRSPNIDDMGKLFDSEAGSVVVPNEDLQAEYAYSVDAGFAATISNFVKIDATAFYTLLDNAMVRRDYTLNGLDSVLYEGELSQVQAIQNAAQSTVYGVQAGIQFDFGAGFGLSSRINYQKGEEELDNGDKSPSRHAAPLFGNTKLTYHYKDLDLQFYAVYNANRGAKDMPEEELGKTEFYALDWNGDPYSPAWYTLNFKAMYRVNETLHVTAGLENITDQRYRPYSSGISAPGRNFILGVKAKF